MSWRFRQSFKIIPGLRLNLSKSGLSASIGGAPFTVNLGPHGVYGTTSIPGTGISFRQRLSGESLSNPQPSAHEPPRPLAPAGNSSWPSILLPGAIRNLPPEREIRSASTELLTSESLKQLKQLVQTAYEEREDISNACYLAKQEDARTQRRFQSWESGFLFKKVFKKSFEVRRVEAEIASAKATELEEQLRLTSISTNIELAREQAEPFFRMRDDFTALSESAAIWDVKSERATNQVLERTIANKLVSREPIRFELANCDLIKWDQMVPHLQNAKGGDIFLYPGFVLYRASKTAFSIIGFHDVKLKVAPVNFHEEDGVPGDSKVIGQTWAKTNKDGSRDKRFVGNYEIPIALYGELFLNSETGLWEEFLFSNPEKLQRFEKSWNTFVASFSNRISLQVGDEISTPEVNPPAESSPKLVGTDVHFECNMCQQPIEVNIEAIGQEFRCPGCGEKLVVPNASNA